MNYLELSKKNVKEESNKLAKKIKLDFEPEIIVFVAKGAFYIGDEISKYFQIPLVEIKAQRKKGILKKIALPFINFLPPKIKQKLREFEIKSNMYNKNFERNISMEEEDLKKLLKYKRVLLVDDSIDTGNTIFQILKFLEKYKLEIEIAALNVLTEAKEKVKVKYYNYENFLLNGPWSNDSKYNKFFLEDYRKWRKN